MKYLLWGQTIPEGVLSAGVYTVLKDTAKAKGLQMLLNLLVHYGGLVALERDIRGNKEILSAIERYIGIWENEIPNEMIRLPSIEG